HGVRPGPGQRSAGAKDDREPQDRAAVDRMARITAPRHRSTGEGHFGPVDPRRAASRHAGDDRSESACGATRSGWGRRARRSHRDKGRMMDFQLSDDQKDLQETARKFARSELMELSREMEE